MDICTLEFWKKFARQFATALLFGSMVFFLNPGCGNVPGDRDIEVESDTGVQSDTGDMTDTNTRNDTDQGMSWQEIKAEVCSLCGDDKECKPDAMKRGKGDSTSTPSEQEIKQWAEQACQKDCPNPESDEGEGCHDFCEKEEEVVNYAWDCPHIVDDEHDTTYRAKVKEYEGTKYCSMGSDHMGSSAEDGENPWGKGQWRYDGGDTMERYDGGSSSWVTCQGECVKPECQ